MKKQTTKRNASDITLRNLKAAAKRHADLTNRLDDLDETVRRLWSHVDAIERRQEAASRQPERVERDDVAGTGITPLPSTASTPETRSEP
jgi:hypothetical protein